MSKPGLPQTVVILGATSGIAEEIARLYAGEGAAIALVGRRANALKEIAGDLEARGAASVEIVIADFLSDDAAKTLDAISAKLGGLDHIHLCFGSMTDQAEAEHDADALTKMLDINFRAAALWASAAANRLEAQGKGALVVLGSVAGDRGRRSNYIYGAAKAGIGVLVQGLAHRMAGKGPRIALIKPGPTDTAMTAHLEKGGVLWSDAATVGKIARKAADKGGPIIYAPARWRLIMLIIRAMPAFIFNKINF